MDSDIHIPASTSNTPLHKGLSGLALTVFTLAMSFALTPPPANSATAGRKTSLTPIYIAKSGDTLDSIASRYGLSVTSVQQANEEALPAAITPGDEVKLPWVPNVLAHPDFSTGAERRMAALPSLTLEFDSNHFTWPVSGSISSGYGPRRGRMHQGIDIQGPVGTPIAAAMGGIVTFAGWDNGGYGYRVDVTHANGYMTRYAHGQQVLVNKGQRVSQGQVLMTRGSTGRSTGPHLHFELRHNGVALNPATILDSRTPLASEQVGPGGIGGAFE